MKRLLNHYIAILILWILGCWPIMAQTIALRTNAAAWAVSVANVGVELVVTESNTVAFETLSSITPLHAISTDVNSLWGMMAEHRFWFTHQPFKAVYVGPVAGINYYKRKDNDQRHLAVPMGIGMGYDWPVSSHWNLEAGLSAGWIYYTESSSVNPFAVEHVTKPSLISISLSALYVF